MAETVTTNEPNLTVVSTVAGTGTSMQPTLAKVYDFHRALARELAGVQPPFVAVSRQEAAGYVMIFTAPNAPAPLLRRVTYDLNVIHVETDAAGVVWWQVNAQPAMWVLRDQVRVK